MAPLLLLLWLGSGLCVQELVPRQCLLGPEVLCRDPGLAAQCGWQQKCKLLEQHKPQPGRHSREDAPAIQCSICTKIMKKLQSLVGDDRDQDTISQAENKVCQRVGRLLQRACRYAIKKFKAKIAQALEDGQDARAICTSLRMCRGPAQGALLPPCDACDLCLTFTRLMLPDLEPSRALGDVLNSTCKRHFGGSPGCDSFVSSYGARLLQALREPWDPLTTCLDAEACQLPEEPAQGEPSSGTDMWAQL